MTIEPDPKALLALSALDRNSAKRRYVVQVAGRRTSLNLEEAYWSAFERISAHAGLSRSELISLIHKNKHPGSSLSAAVRLYVLNYVGLSARQTAFRHRLGKERH